MEEGLMWKPVGVVGLWLVLLVVPHLGSHAVHVSPAGVQVAAMAANEDQADQADPSLEPSGAAATKARGEAEEKAEVPNAFVTIRFKNALDKTLTLESAAVTMDGKPLSPVVNLTRQHDNIVFTGRLTPGEHTISTRLTCVGRRRAGVFTYLKDYRWQVTQQHTLKVLPNRSMIFTVSAVRRIGPYVPPDQQVHVSVYNELLPETTSMRN
jgi:hypothetical protein